MLTEVSLTNFKAFLSLSLEMRPLTVLTGLNNAGKSSVIQAILLAEIARDAQTYVQLNGPFGLSLGEASDVLAFAASSAEIRVVLAGDDWSEEFVFDVPDERSVALLQRHADTDAGRRPALVGTYLSAERLGPRDLLEVDTETHVAIRQDAPSAPDDEPIVVGHQGQYTPHVLAQYDRRQVSGPLRHPGSGTNVSITLGTQAELWLGEITHPIQVQATWLPGTNAATVRFRGYDARSDWMRPPNVGFGISYALPVVVGALASDSRHILIVENPEAHLHPAGQSAIGRFLALVAASGTQIIVETHSDHVVNGMRLAVSDRNELRADDVILHFFAEEQVVPIRIQDTGSLSAWPSRFFDQAERDLAALSRVTRPT